MSLIALIIWIMLMILWVIGAGYVSYSGPTPNHPYFVAYGIIPWICVLILGLFVFGAFGSTSNIVPGPVIQDRR